MNVKSREIAVLSLVFFLIVAASSSALVTQDLSTSLRDEKSIIDKLVDEHSDSLGRVFIDDMVFLGETLLRFGFYGNPWTEGIVYYEFDPALTEAQRASWILASQEWGECDCISFAERVDEENYVYVFEGDGNWSYVGMVGGRQEMSIVSWSSIFTIVHEIGHALGIHHEHQRSDRDLYVYVDFDNIQDDYEHNFIVLETENIGEYDFDSLMHYDACAFSIDCPPGYTCSCSNNSIMVLPPNEAWQELIGQRDHVSVLDIQGLNSIYCDNGNVVHVPADEPTIQAGIIAADEGDTVLVACGTYYEHDITMKSGITLRSETGNPECVIIDAQQLGRVLTCGNTSTETRLEGITFKGGMYLDGGGVYCTNHSSPTFDFCSFESNVGQSTGGAVYCESYSSPVFHSCSFIDNLADASGGAVRLREYSSPTFYFCEFSGNVAVLGNGGALICADFSDPTFQECRFRNNSGENGGALSSRLSSTISLFDSEIVDNDATTYGGGIYCDHTSIILEDCLVQGNNLSAPNSKGGGLHLENPPSFTISGCVIAINRAENSGGGMVVAGYSGSDAISSSTLYGNAANLGGGITSNNSALLIENSIIAMSQDGEALYCEGSGEAALICCDVYGNEDGDWIGCIDGQLGSAGNISMDPLLCDPEVGDYHLRVDSPCVPDNNDCFVLIGAHPEGCTIAEAYWDFEEMVGDVAHDQTGNGHDGSITGAIWINGHNGSGCLTFDGQDDFVRMDGGSWLTIPAGTIEAWVNVHPDVSISQRIISTETGGYHNGFNFGYAFETYDNIPLSGAIVCGIHSTENGNHHVEAYIDGVSRGEWHYTAVTWDAESDSILLYVDGSSSTVISPHPGIVDTGEPFTIGCWEVDVMHGGWFKGQVDEVRLFNRRMTLEELHDRYLTYPTGVTEYHPDDHIPRLADVFPNPFNPTTTIQFSLPVEKNISLAVYDLSGRLISKIIDNEYYQAGIHTVSWEGADQSSSRVASGVYFCQLISGDSVSTKKMVLIK